MKIAGRRNDGAWFRTNVAIQQLNQAEKENLAGSIDSSMFIDAAYNAMVAMIARTGIQGITFPATTAEWATKMVANGIPRQVWLGVLSWAPYTPVTSHSVVKGTKTIYVQDGQSQMREFANDLRKICKQYFLARRQVRDIFSIGTRAEGNVGGDPDASRLS